MLLTRITPLIWTIVFAIALWFPLPALASNYPPPLSYSNAELTGKDFSGQILVGAEFANSNLQFTNFGDADLRGTVFSGSVMTKVNLHGANLSYGMLDQANLTGVDLSDAILVETILLGSTFKDTNITGADFTNAILDGAQVQELCAKAIGINSKTNVATSDSLGCQ